jgi:hypothetical protein
MEPAHNPLGRPRMIVLHKTRRQSKRLELVSAKSLRKKAASVLKDIWDNNNNLVEIFRFDSNLHALASYLNAGTVHPCLSSQLIAVK